MKIIAHRGGSGLAPENSLQSIALAHQLGVDAIEIDVRLTKDNKFIVCHDSNLKRLAHQPITIYETTIDQLKGIPLLSGEHLIELDEAVAAAKNTTLIIEAKGTEWSVELAKTLKMYPPESVTVISFNHLELNAFKQLCPTIEVYAVGHINIIKTIKNARRFHFDGICIPYFGLNPLTYSITTRHNLKIGVYVVNSKLLASLIAKLYPKVDITTDKPSKFKGPT